MFLFFFVLFLVLGSNQLFNLSSLIFFLRALCVLFSWRALRENNLRIILVINFHAKAAKIFRKGRKVGICYFVNLGSIGIKISHEPAFAGRQVHECFYFSIVLSLGSWFKPNHLFFLDLS